MGKPRLLDLFCGGGGCSVGYARAGFDVSGTDVHPQPHYPFPFRRAHALVVPLDGYDVIHASPPCQVFSALRNLKPGEESKHPDMVEIMRRRLQEWGGPYVIENVPGAPLIDPVMVCGASFGLGVDGFNLGRHRIFESNLPIVGTACACEGHTIGVYGHGQSGYPDLKRRTANARQARKALGIGWMNRDEMAQAIPPAYTAFVGEQVLRLSGLSLPAPLVIE